MFTFNNSNLIIVTQNPSSLSELGVFFDKDDVVVKVDLGQSFKFRCPRHTSVFGAVFEWLHNRRSTRFSRDERRGISPDGTLIITYVTQKDIDDINESQGIKCRMTGGDSFQISGTLKLEKNNPQQSGKVGRKKVQKIVRQLPRLEGPDIHQGVDLVTPIPRGISRIDGESITQTQSTLPKIVRYSHSLSPYPITLKTSRVNQGTALRVPD